MLQQLFDYVHHHVFTTNRYHGHDHLFTLSKAAINRGPYCYSLHLHHHLSLNRFTLRDFWLCTLDLYQPIPLQNRLYSHLVDSCRLSPVVEIGAGRVYHLFSLLFEVVGRQRHRHHDEAAYYYWIAFVTLLLFVRAGSQACKLHRREALYPFCYCVDFLFSSHEASQIFALPILQRRASSFFLRPCLGSR